MNNISKTSNSIIDFNDVLHPEVIAIVSGGGTGSKLFQSFLDNHEEIIMIPAYPLKYFYPHWFLWEKIFVNQWKWETLIEAFCEKHASVLDSRKIPGHNGLANLGKSQNEHINIDENLFRCHLLDLVRNQKISSKTFLLAIHYAYALCKNENLIDKKIIVYHIHDLDYLIKYLIKDFPDLRTITMLRDKRATLARRTQSNWGVDDAKLNKSDAIIYRKYGFYQAIEVQLNELNKLSELPYNNIMAIRHEDLGKTKEIMSSVANYLGIKFSQSMLEMTFDGKSWWGDKLYKRELMNTFNPEILSNDWQKTISLIDWFLIEGLSFEYFKKYNYQLYKYRKDNLLSKIFVFFAIIIPTKTELYVFLWYLSPTTHIKLIKESIDECTGRVEIKDYTWSASHIFNRTYVELKLWQQPWYISFLNYCRKLKKEGSLDGINYVILIISRIVYILANYGRIWLTIISYTLIIFKRWKIAYTCYFRRIRKSSCLPKWIDIRT